MATKVKTETSTTVICDDGFTYEPNRSYKGSARVDDEGNFNFRPYRQGGDESSKNMRLITSGIIANNNNFEWQLYRGKRTLKIVLSVREYKKVSDLPHRLPEIFRNLFFKASDRINESIS